MSLCSALPRRGAMMADEFTQDDLRMWQKDSSDLNEVGLILGVKAGELRELVVQQAKNVMSGYDALRAENAKLTAFKTYTHQRLDELGIPHTVPSPHTDAGCRVGG